MLFSGCLLAAVQYKSLVGEGFVCTCLYVNDITIQISKKVAHIYLCIKYVFCKYKKLPGMEPVLALRQQSRLWVTKPWNHAPLLKSVYIHLAETSVQYQGMVVPHEDLQICW